MKKTITALCAALILTGCGTTAKLSQSDVGKPISAGTARIIIKRDTSLLYFAGVANVEINGEKVAGLAPGGEAVHDVKAGDVNLSVHTPLALKKYIIKETVKAGQTKTFIVSPIANPGNILFGAIGEAVQGDKDGKAGYFSIRPEE